MKKILAILLTLVFSATILFSVSAQERPRPISLTVNEEVVECDVPPQLVEDRTLVPLRAVFESLGAKIMLWDESTSTVHAQAPNGDVISLQIGSNKLFMANEVYEMDVPAVIIGDRTMVPIRAIAECLDCQVEWLPEVHEVRITTA